MSDRNLAAAQRIAVDVIHDLELRDRLLWMGRDRGERGSATEAASMLSTRPLHRSSQAPGVALSM